MELFTKTVLARTKNVCCDLLTENIALFIASIPLLFKTLKVKNSTQP